MRKYADKKVKEINKIYCNHCGKEIAVENGIVKEGVLSVDTNWGYFSKKDGQVHSFDLCEECYDALTKNFVFPVEKSDQKELI